MERRPGRGRALLVLCAGTGRDYIRPDDRNARNRDPTGRRKEPEMSARGGPVWFLEGRDRDGGKVRIEFSKRELKRTGAMVIGRAVQGAQLHLFDSTIGRRHAEIAWTGDGPTIALIGSSQGVAVNGVALDDTSAVPFGVGDEIRIGALVLTVRQAADD